MFWNLSFLAENLSGFSEADHDFMENCLNTDNPSYGDTESLYRRLKSGHIDRLKTKDRVIIQK